jgi:hypothetical protein
MGRPDDSKVEVEVEAEAEWLNGGLIYKASLEGFTGQTILKLKLKLEGGLIYEAYL